jgi:MOSC domain-containing protein YiiM
MAAVDHACRRFEPARRDRRIIAACQIGVEGTHKQCAPIPRADLFENDMMLIGQVIAVARDKEHHFSKKIVDEINIMTGLGVEGDAHRGLLVKHRSRVRVDPNQPNLRQVHLIHAELFDELFSKGLHVGPAELGENITTRGIELLALPTGTLLRIGYTTELEVTGLRNPCGQIEQFQSGLLAAVLDRGAEGQLVRKTGIMTIVRAGGTVRPGDPIKAELPSPPYLPLARV